MVPFVFKIIFVASLYYNLCLRHKYPIDIYGKGLMRFCTYVIPYTLVQYYPLCKPSQIEPASQNLQHGTDRAHQHPVKLSLSDNPRKA